MRKLLHQTMKSIFMAMAVTLLAIPVCSFAQDKTAKMDEYVGEYRLDEKGLVFTKEGDKLIVQKVGDDRKIELIADGVDKFNAPNVGAAFTFTRNDKRKVSRVIVKVEEGEFPLERVK